MSYIPYKAWSKAFNRTGSRGLGLLWIYPNQRRVSGLDTLKPKTPLSTCIRHGTRKRPLNNRHMRKDLCQVGSLPIVSILALFWFSQFYEGFYKVTQKRNWNGEYREGLGCGSMQPHGILQRSASGQVTSQHCSVRRQGSFRK